MRATIELFLVMGIVQPNSIFMGVQDVLRAGWVVPTVCERVCRLGQAATHDTSCRRNSATAASCDLYVLFEAQFLRTSRAIYQVRRQAWDASDSVHEYLKNVRAS